MSSKLILIFAFIFGIIKGIEEFSEALTELNDFITVTENIEFSIKTIYNEAVAYFDSVDKNCLVYTNNERIDGRFYRLTTTKDYIISVKLFNPGSVCILKRYLSHLPQNIYLKGNSTNFLYFKQFSRNSNSKNGIQKQK